MAGLRGPSQAVLVLDGTLQLGGSSRLIPANPSRVASTRPAGFSVRAQQGSTEAETSRRNLLGLVAAGLAAGSLSQAALAITAKPIKVGPPPPLSGGLPGTLNSDEARDLQLPLKERFYIQPLTPAQAAQRAKESAKEIVNVKEFIDKKAWPYVQNDLRLRAEYLRFDLNTIISAKPKNEKLELKELTGKLFQTLNDLDYAARSKDSSQAQKYYAETVSTLNDVLAKLG